MSPIRALIVDDEPLARTRIRSLLEGYDDIRVVGECSDGRAAVDSIGREMPDLVFLDIEMPEVDGFGVIEQALSVHNPAIIFVTAYDQHAVRAFDVHALDYLLKPFDAERFAVAIDRARRQLAANGEHRRELEQRMLSALEQLRSQDYADRLVIKSEERLYFVDVAEVEWIEAAGKYVKLHAGQQQHLLREPLQHLESRLDPQEFVRIHRSTIVNLNAVQSMEALFHGEYRVSLKDGTQLSLSRSYRAKLRERFGNLL